MKIEAEKRGLTPVVATILLVALAIIIAVIILLWARGFMKEIIEKSIAGKSERIENFCGDLSFSADVFLTDSKLEIGVTNTGDIPIYGVQITKVDETKGSKVNTGQIILNGGSLTSGESSSGEVNSGIPFEEGDSVLIVPILLGEVKEQKTWYVCDEQYGAEEVVA